MSSLVDTERTVVYLGPDNEQEWARLHRAIELTEGFALYLISVQDLSTAAELIRRLQHGFPDRTTHHFTLADKTKPEVAELLQQIAHLPPEALVILSGLDEQKLPVDFWVRFNERRNFWQRHNPHTHLWFVNSSIRQQIRTQAPDIYSIRSLDFLFTLPPSAQERFSERASTPPPPWLGTADSLMAEASQFATDQTPTGRLLYGRALGSVVQRLRFEGRLDEALKVIQKGLALARKQASTDLQAAFLLELGVLKSWLNQLLEAQALYQEALLFYHQGKNVLGEANALKALGDLHTRRDNAVEARRTYETALSIYRTLHNRLGEANTLQALGDLKMREADLAGARQAYETALAFYREIGDCSGEANTQRGLGDVLMREANLAGARRAYESALSLHQVIGNRLGEADCRQGLGDLLSAENKPGEAVQELLEALTIHLDIHDILGCGADLVYLGRITHAAQKHALAVLFFEEALATYRTIHDSFDQALALQGQRRALGALDFQVGAWAALWQAREIYRSIQHPAAVALDAIFARMEQEHPEDYPQLIADLQTHAEELRQEAVATVRQAAADDPLLQQISAAVRTLLAPEG